MSTTPTLSGAVDSGVIRRVDLRSHARYPIMLKLCYQLLRTNGVKHRGFGRTLDMSSGGVRFEADDTFDGSDIRHGEIQLDMEWPLLLGQVCKLKLVMRGRIVRWDNRWVAVRLEQYEFRTAGAIARTPEVRKRERATANSDGPYCR